MHIAVVGPASPVRLAGELDASDRRHAEGYLDLGGTAVVELVRSLLAKGHRITVVTAHHSPGFGPARFVGPNLDIVVAAGRTRARDWLGDLYHVERRQMMQTIRDAKPDIVHAHWTYEFELAAQDSDLLHVTTARDSPFTILRRTRDMYRVARLGVALRARPGIQQLSVVSPYLATAWRRQLLYRRPIRVMPNSIPQDVLTMRRDPAPHPVVTYIADAGPLKNVRTLLQAFRLVRASIPSAELHLIGAGLGPGEHAALWAETGGLAQNVRFLGPLAREQVAFELSISWLYTHASLEESFGNAVLEAASAGVPVLGGRRSGGVPYVLGYGAAGWLTDVRNPAALSESMVALLDRPHSPPPTTSAYLARFAPEHVAADYVAWYEFTLEHHAIGHPTP